jgi:hypothetical protein
MRKENKMKKTSVLIVAFALLWILAPLPKALLQEENVVCAAFP